MCAYFIEDYVSAHRWDPLCEWKSVDVPKIHMK